MNDPRPSQFLKNSVRARLLLEGIVVTLEVQAEARRNRARRRPGCRVLNWWVLRKQLLIEAVMVEFLPWEIGVSAVFARRMQNRLRQFRRWLAGDSFPPEAQSFDAFKRLIEQWQCSFVDDLCAELERLRRRAEEARNAQEVIELSDDSSDC